MPNLLMSYMLKNKSEEYELSKTSLPLWYDSITTKIYLFVLAQFIIDWIPDCRPFVPPKSKSA